MKNIRAQLADWLDGLSLEAGLLLILAFVLGLILLLTVVTKEAFDTGRQDRAAHDQNVQSLRGSQP